MPAAPATHAETQHSPLTSLIPCDVGDLKHERTCTYRTTTEPYCATCINRMCWPLQVPEQDASSHALLLSVALLMVMSDAAGEGVRRLEGPEAPRMSLLPSRAASLPSGAGPLIIYTLPGL